MSSVRLALSRLLRVLGSYGLACIILVLLLLLVFLCTLEQADHSLYDVQKRYFESLFVVGDILPIPLPGAYLLLSALFVNLLVGGILRVRQTRSRIGVFIIHIGIAILLIGSMVEYSWSTKGHVTLFEGEAASEFSSYNEWELAVTRTEPDGGTRTFQIPDEQFADLGRGETRRFSAAGLPFDIVLGGYVRNCRPRPASADGGIDGFELEDLGNAAEAEQNMPGLVVRLESGSGQPRTGLLWGRQRAPLRFGDATLDLRKRRFPLPFEVRMKKFSRELHPGTGMARAFSSDVTRVQNGVAQDVHISMNEPMRHAGYTFYQSGWGPQDAREGDRLFSTFSVVYNPADRVPLFATVVIAAGLLWQFLRKLRLHIQAESRRVR